MHAYECSPLLGFPRLSIARAQRYIALGPYVMHACAIGGFEYQPWNHFGGVPGFQHCEWPL